MRHPSHTHTHTMKKIHKHTHTMNQKERILFHLDRGPVSQIDCVNWHPPILRLSSIIFKLKEEGYSIASEALVTKGGARLASYHLVRKPGDPPGKDRRKIHENRLF